MYALTIHEPWATLIMMGVKRIENRTWATVHRGPLVIHAGQSINRPMVDKYDLWDDITPGHALGTVDVVDCIPVHRVDAVMETAMQIEEFAEGPNCWMLQSPQRFERPIAIHGQQGLWDWPY